MILLILFACAPSPDPVAEPPDTAAFTPASDEDPALDEMQLRGDDPAPLRDTAAFTRAARRR